MAGEVLIYTSSSQSAPPQFRIDKRERGFAIPREVLTEWRTYSEFLSFLSEDYRFKEAILMLNVDGDQEVFEPMVWKDWAFARGVFNLVLLIGGGEDGGQDHSPWKEEIQDLFSSSSCPSSSSSEDEEEDYRWELELEHYSEDTYELLKDFKVGKVGKGKQIMKFAKGSQVQVASVEKGLIGVWYDATILEAKGDGKYLIQYTNRKKNQDDKNFLRQEILTCRIRPSPPEIIILDGFSLLDEVEVYYNHGWWVGVIAEVVNGSNYVVHLKYSKETMVFKEADLRPHQDWSNGKWAIPCKAPKQ